MQQVEEGTKEFVNNKHSRLVKISPDNDAYTAAEVKPLIQEHFFLIVLRNESFKQARNE